MCPPTPPGNPRTESWCKKLHSYFQAESQIKYYVAKNTAVFLKKITDTRQSRRKNVDISTS